MKVRLTHDYEDGSGNRHLKNKTGVVPNYAIKFDMVYDVVFEGEIVPSKIPGFFLEPVNEFVDFKRRR